MREAALFFRQNRSYQNYINYYNGGEAQYVLGLYFLNFSDQAELDKILPFIRKFRVKSIDFLECKVFFKCDFGDCVVRFRQCLIMDDKEPLLFSSSTKSVSLQDCIPTSALVRALRTTGCKVDVLHANWTDFSGFSSVTFLGTEAPRLDNLPPNLICLHTKGSVISQSVVWPPTLNVVRAIKVEFLGDMSKNQWNLERFTTDTHYDWVKFVKTKIFDFEGITFHSFTLNRSVRDFRSFDSDRNFR
jgi:hypothetical protein